MTGDKSQNLSQIRSECDQIKTCEDLTAFVDSLINAVDNDIFEYHDVRSYLDGVSSVLFGMKKSAPETPDWKVFGHILVSAFFR